jgi:hypothetical protein
MGPIGHFAVGLAAKPVAPKVPLGLLFLATWLLDVLAIAFGFAGIEGVKRNPLVTWSLHVSYLVGTRRDLDLTHLS